MNKILLAVFVCLIAFAAVAHNAAAAPLKPDTSGLTEEQKTLYFLGKAVSSKIKQYDFTPEETEYIIKGFSEALAGKGIKLEDAYGTKLNEYLARKKEVTVPKQKEASMTFLDIMANEPGAIKLASGVIYIPMKEGAGAFPKASDMVRVHYHGTFPDGKVFDSSVERGTPTEFQLSGVIPCWTEGVQKIKVGGKAKLVCPSETAYGDKGAGGAIPGGATLVFEVQLLDILKESAYGEQNEPASKNAKRRFKKEPFQKRNVSSPKCMQILETIAGGRGGFPSDCDDLLQDEIPSFAQLGRAGDGALKSANCKETLDLCYGMLINGVPVVSQEPAAAVGTNSKDSAGEAKPQLDGYLGAKWGMSATEVRKSIPAMDLDEDCLGAAAGGVMCFRTEDGAKVAFFTKGKLHGVIVSNSEDNSTTMARYIKEFGTPAKDEYKDGVKEGPILSHILTWEDSHGTLSLSLSHIEMGSTREFYQAHFYPKEKSKKQAVKRKANAKEQ